MKPSNSENGASKPPAPTNFQELATAIAVVVLLQILYNSLMEAYRIRLYSIEEFGIVLHQFDPYFNFRATKYLWEHGFKAFFHWFDYLSWYPLGRPVGTTIYPGMPIAAVAIKKFLMPDWSLAYICCLIPAWFGVTATAATAWLTYECCAGQHFGCILSDFPLIRESYESTVVPLVQRILSTLMERTGSDWGLAPRQPSSLTPLTCAVVAAAIMSILPAHLMRSAAGAYDNEAVAMTAMVLSFASWTRALRDDVSLATTGAWGAITGVAYFCMVSTWGGYVYALNLIALHAGFLVLMGRYSSKLHRAYTWFYLTGTVLAVQVPVVGWAPLKSLEQMGPLIAFLGLQLIEVSEIVVRKRNARTPLQIWQIRLTVLLVAGAAIGAAVIILTPTGYFAPISARTRCLFLQHTIARNPLADSVAEHRAVDERSFGRFLSIILYLTPLGFYMMAVIFLSDSSSFLLIYAVTAYYFSLRMVRLMILTAPIASCFGGIVLGRLLVWMFSSIAGEPIDLWSYYVHGTKPIPGSNQSDADDRTSPLRSSKRRGRHASELPKRVDPTTDGPRWVKGARLAISACLVSFLVPMATEFWDYSHDLAMELSHPKIMHKATLRDGQEVLVDDIRESYYWLKENTPMLSRVLCWWDYGYQIAELAERTTLADGNTWNHEHIALLGRILTSPEDEAHSMARHLADYVLLWTLQNGDGDCLSKSQHMRRIANSVFRGLCSEHTCRDFGFYSNGTPSESMSESLVYKLSMHKLRPGVEADPVLFKEVHRSKFGQVRIFKILGVSSESKAFVEDPANRLCDAPGSWFCPGQYPPALDEFLKEKRDFEQLGDFNRRPLYDDPAYLGSAQVREVTTRQPSQALNDQDTLEVAILPSEEIEKLNEAWEDNKKTAMLEELVVKGETKLLRDWIARAPEVPHLRSADGRGPMWWAHEHGQGNMIIMLKALGVSENRRDKYGLSPLDMRNVPNNA